MKTVVPDKYNQPVDYDSLIERSFNNLLLELLPYKDTLYFIYAGVDTAFLITNRTKQSVIGQITEAVHLGKKNIVFECMWEAIPISVIHYIHDVIEQARLLFSDIKFFYITAAIDGEEVYLDILRRSNHLPNMEILSFHTFEFLAPSFVSHEVKLSTTYEVKVRPKNYVCLNRVNRLHRTQLLDRLLSEKLVNDKCYYSYHDHNSAGFSQDELKKFTSIAHNIEYVNTLQLNRNPNRFNPVDIIEEDLYLFNDTYFSLVTETLYHDYESCRWDSSPCVFFSEKVYKPMTLLHPFVLVSRPYCLVALRDRGFKTFHPYIDETYDTIENDNDRMNAIVNEVKRLCQQTTEQWLDWCKNVKSIVEHNKQQLHEPASYFVYKDLSSLM